MQVHINNMDGFFMKCSLYLYLWLDSLVWHPNTKQWYNFFIAIDFNLSSDFNSSTKLQPETIVLCIWFPGAVLLLLFVYFLCVVAVVVPLFPSIDALLKEQTLRDKS